MARASIWANPDGLAVGFGRHTNDYVSKVTASAGAEKVLTYNIIWSDLVDTISATNKPLGSTVIKRGSVINKATIQATVAWTGAGSLDIGTWGVGLTTEVVDDADGIDAAIDIDHASTGFEKIGNVIECNGALVAGVSVSILTVGETSLSDVIITASYNTVPTAGEAVITVWYTEPAYTDATLASVT